MTPYIVFQYTLPYGSDSVTIVAVSSVQFQYTLPYGSDSHEYLLIHSLYNFNTHSLTGVIPEGDPYPLVY